MNVCNTRVYRKRSVRTRVCGALSPTLDPRGTFCTPKYDVVVDGPFLIDSSRGRIVFKETAASIRLK